MGIVNSVGAALKAAGRFVTRFTWGVSKFIYSDTYTAAGDAAGTVINMFMPKAGEVFKGGQLSFAALGSLCTLEVGVGADGAGNAAIPNLFLAATSAGAAGHAALDPGAAALLAYGYVFDGQTWVIITTDGAPATGEIQLDLDVAAQD